METSSKDRWAWLRRSDHNYLIPFVLNWIRATVEVKNQEKEMARLQSEIDRMDQEINDLRNNRDSLESFARSTYHFASPGDDVYIVE